MQLGRIEFSPCNGCLCASECMPFGTCMKARSKEPPTPRLYQPSHPAAMLTAMPAATGWICPRCQVVHAPFVPRCACAKPANREDGND